MLVLLRLRLMLIMKGQVQSLLAGRELLNGVDVITGINAPRNTDISIFNAGQVIIAAMNISTSPDLLEALLKSGSTS